MISYENSEPKCLDQMMLNSGCNCHGTLSTPTDEEYIDYAR